MQLGKKVFDDVGMKARSKMAQALSEAWQKGERALVMQTISGGMNAEIRDQWRKDTVAMLPVEQREEFQRHVGE